MECRESIEDATPFTIASLALELLVLLGAIVVSLKFVRYSNEASKTRK